MERWKDSVVGDPVTVSVLGAEENSLGSNNKTQMMGVMVDMVK